LSFHISVCVLNFADDRRKFESDFQKTNPLGDASFVAVLQHRLMFRGHPREINFLQALLLAGRSRYPRMKNGQRLFSFFSKIFCGAHFFQIGISPQTKVEWASAGDHRRKKNFYFPTIYFSFLGFMTDFPQNNSSFVPRFYFVSAEVFFFVFRYSELRCDRKAL